MLKEIEIKAYQKIQKVMESIKAKSLIEPNPYRFTYSEDLRKLNIDLGEFNTIIDKLNFEKAITSQPVIFSDELMLPFNDIMLDMTVCPNFEEIYNQYDSLISDWQKTVKYKEYYVDLNKRILKIGENIIKFKLINKNLLFIFELIKEAPNLLTYKEILKRIHCTTEDPYYRCKKIKNSLVTYLINYPIPQKEPIEKFITSIKAKAKQGYYIK